MKRRTTRCLRPDLEPIERRELLSAITAVMSGSATARLAGRHTQRAHVSAAGGSENSASFPSSISLGGVPLNQGPTLNPDGSINNLALAPTGTPKPGERRRQKFVARFEGPYTVLPGRTSTEATQVVIQGAGTSNTMLHSDIQIRIVTPKDRSLPVGGASTIFDRNLNTNTALGLDLSAPQANIDPGGRPNHFPTVSLDANTSSGTYVEGFAQGTVKIRYLPGSKRSIPGAISQGTAIVTVKAQIYAPNVSFLLRNSRLNP